MKKVLVFILFALSLNATAQFNTDRLMITGRSALFYEDYVLSIQYFNQVLNAKPYLYGFSEASPNSILTTMSGLKMTSPRLSSSIPTYLIYTN